jgi:enoyl-CoA hydratase
MSDEGRIATERRGQVFLMGIDRVAKRNAFDLAMFAALGVAYGELERDGALRCGVLFAHGEHFTAGIDLAQWAPVMAAGGSPNLPEGALDPFGFGVVAPRLTKPLVIALQGICLTLGIELALSADIRIAAADTRFAQIEVKRGIYPAGGATIRLPREIGWGNAMRYLLTGDEFNAETALRMGFVQEVVETGRQLDRAVEIAETIAAQAPLGVRQTILSARLADRQGEEAAARRLLPDMAPIAQSEDAKEGVRSFLERRPARFQGR